MSHTIKNPNCPCAKAGAIQPPCQPVSGIAACVCAPGAALAAGYSSSQIMQYATCKQSTGYAAATTAAPPPAQAPPAPVPSCACAKAGSPQCGYGVYCTCAPKNAPGPAGLLQAICKAHAPGPPGRSLMVAPGRPTSSDPDEDYLFRIGYRPGTTQFDEALARRKKDRDAGETLPQ